MSKEVDALSSSMSAQLEKLKYGVSASVGDEGSAAVTQAKILTESSSRQLRAELDGRISALEVRVVQCEQHVLRSGCCWISVRDTAVEVFENKVVRAAVNLLRHTRTRR